MTDEQERQPLRNIFEMAVEQAEKDAYERGRADERERCVRALQNTPTLVGPYRMLAIDAIVAPKLAIDLEELG